MRPAAAFDAFLAQIPLSAFQADADCERRLQNKLDTQHSQTIDKLATMEAINEERRHSSHSFLIVNSFYSFIKECIHLFVDT